MFFFKDYLETTTDEDLVSLQYESIEMCLLLTKGIV